MATIVTGRWEATPGCFALAGVFGFGESITGGLYGFSQLIDKGDVRWWGYIGIVGVGELSFWRVKTPKKFLGDIGSDFAESQYEKMLIKEYEDKLRNLYLRDFAD